MSKAPQKLQQKVGDVRPRCLALLSLQFFAIMLYLILAQSKHELYLGVVNRQYSILLSLPLFLAASWTLGKISSKHYLLGFILYLIVTLSSLWCIVYFCIIYQKESVLNTGSALFGSMIGLFIEYYYQRKKQNQILSIAEDSNTSVYTGTLSSTVGVILIMNIMSYLLVPFNISSTAVAMTVSLVFSFAIIETLKSIVREEQMGSLKAVGLLYSRTPLYIWGKLKAFGKYVIDLEWI